MPNLNNPTHVTDVEYTKPRLVSSCPQEHIHLLHIYSPTFPKQTKPTALPNTNLPFPSPKIAISTHPISQPNLHPKPLLCSQVPSLCHARETTFPNLVQQWRPTRNLERKLLQVLIVIHIRINTLLDCLCALFAVLLHPFVVVFFVAFGFVFLSRWYTSAVVLYLCTYFTCIFASIKGVCVVGGSFLESVCSGGIAF